MARSYEGEKGPVEQAPLVVSGVYDSKRLLCIAGFSLL